MNCTLKDIKDKNLVSNAEGTTFENISNRTVKKVTKIEPGAAKANVKVKNATKVEAYGLTFGSKLEYYLYNALKNAAIEFEFQKVIILQPKFNYNGKTVRALKIIVDFALKDIDMIIDSKGWGTAVSKLKYKMLEYQLYMAGSETTIEMPSTTKEVDLLINRLLYDTKH